MREIKFKIWTPSGKYMSGPFDAATSDGADDISMNLCNQKRILLQYTGLRDKNGKEIYEGDIVKINGYGEYRIIFAGGYFQTDLITKIGTEPFMFDPDLLINGSEYYQEILGNIYENPELLESKNES